MATVCVFLPRFSQPQSYHSFADSRSLLGIPNFGNVISNLPFAVIGFLGIAFLLRSGSDPSCGHFLDSRERWPYMIAFVGMLLTAFGSSYYHLNPNNARLVWDRLPMTLVFMSMVAAMIAERVQLRLGLILLPLLLIIGVASVLQWYESELHGVGDLRFYAAVQAYSALMLLIVLLFPPRYSRGYDLAIIVGFYALAKALEMLDRPIFSIGHLVSGHTLKHLAAAAAGYWLLRMLWMRRLSPLETTVRERRKLLTSLWRAQPFAKSSCRSARPSDALLSDNASLCRFGRKSGDPCLR